MDDVGKRLDKAAKIGGFKSRRQMAKALGISYDTFNNWVRNNKITERGAVQIASKIPISQTYLLTGEGDAEVYKPKVVQHFNNSPVGAAHAEGNAHIHAQILQTTDETPKLKEDEAMILKKYRELNEEQREDVFLEILGVIKEAKRKQ